MQGQFNSIKYTITIVPDDIRKQRERGLMKHKREQKMMKCCDALKIVHK